MNSKQLLCHALLTSLAKTKSCTFKKQVQCMGIRLETKEPILLTSPNELLLSFDMKIYKTHSCNC